MVKNCYVCGGTNMGEQWPWEAKELEYTNISKNPNITWHTTIRPTRWLLKSTRVGEICFIRMGNYATPVGDLLCKTGILCNKTRTWYPKGYYRPNPFNPITQKHLHSIWNRPCNRLSKWRAPDPLYWICNNIAYTELLKNWKVF